MADDSECDIDAELLEGFVDEAEEGLGAVDGLFVTLEQDVKNIDTINAIFRPVHTVKGNAAFFGLMSTKKLAHEMETVLTLAREDKLTLDASSISLLLEGLDELRAILDRTREGQAEVADEAGFAALIGRIKTAQKCSHEKELTDWQGLLAELSRVQDELNDVDQRCGEKLHAVIALVETLREGPSDGETDKPAQATSAAPAAPTETAAEPARTEADGKDGANNKDTAGSDARKTLRVTEESVDRFLDYVGELIVVAEMYSHLQKAVSECELGTSLATDFKRVNETFDGLSASLQNSIMEIRKVSVRTLFQKTPRMVRDIATANGKQIKVILVGEDIQIDKRLVETLDGPLTHMVRNAADHGIEPTAEREAAGKTPQGTVTIAVVETDDHVTLSISDDGRGLDLDAIQAKAVKMGLIEADQPLEQEDLINLLFASGVSTAQEITEVSGRGVGMDVVKRNIDAANGKVSIETEAGQGTVFSIQLAKTVSTQIIDGFLLGVGGSIYVTPMEQVLEVFHPEPESMTNVAARGTCVLRHGELLNVIDLRRVLKESRPGDDSDEGAGIMVSTHIGRRKAAIHVDEVLSVQKVVVKELKGLELTGDLYAGAAVMGDGTVAMILDLNALEASEMAGIS